jgi:fatty acid-binding protein DegV
MQYLKTQLYKVVCELKHFVIQSKLGILVKIGRVKEGFGFTSSTYNLYLYLKYNLYLLPRTHKGRHQAKAKMEGSVCNAKWE